MICHVVPSISEEASGPSYSVRRLCRELNQENCSTILATLNWSYLKDPPYFLKTFDMGAGPRRLGRSPTMHQWLDNEARNKKISLLHAHSLFMMPNIYPSWVARNHNVPLVISPRGAMSQWALTHGSIAKRLFWPLLQRPACSAAHCFHVTSFDEYKDVRRLGFRQPVAIIPNGIDIPATAAAASSDSRRTLLFLGRIHPKKGIDILLHAWHAIQNTFPEWELKIVGPDDGLHLAELKAMAQLMTLERVSFYAPLFGDEKLAAYRDADLFVLPTHSENFGMTVAEALAAGTPAIVTRGAPWAGLETRGAGWWIEIGIDPLVEVLQQAMSETAASLKKRGERGREWMREDFSWSEIARRMALTYDWLINRGNRPEWIETE